MSAPQHDRDTTDRTAELIADARMVSNAVTTHPAWRVRDLLRHLASELDAAHAHAAEAYQAATERAAAQDAELARLRRLLWLWHGHEGLYGDDGEMQCAQCLLDFKRDSVERIDAVLYAEGLRGAVVYTPTPLPAAAPGAPTGRATEVG